MLIYIILINNIVIMKLVKVDFIQKILIYILNIYLLINIFIIPKNIFDLSVNYKYLFFYIVNIILFYFVIKNKLNAIKLYIFLLIFYIVSNLWSPFFYNISPQYYLSNLEWVIIDNSSIFIIIWINFFIMIPFFLNLYLLRKNINLWVDNINQKIVTDKDNSKWFIYFNIWLLILILIFRFWYYDKPNDKIKKIDDSFFTTKYQNINISDNDNLFIDLKKIKYEELEIKSQKLEFVNCLYKNECFNIEFYKWYIEWIDTKKIKKVLIDKENNNDILEVKEYLKKNINYIYKFKNEELLNKDIGLLNNVLSKKQYFKNNTDEVVVYTDLIKFNRDLSYKILYYLNNNQEKEAILLLNNQIKLSNTMLNWDLQLIESLVWISTQWTNLRLLSLILDNYDLSEESKSELLNNISEIDNYSYSLDNWLKNEYKYIIENWVKVINESLWKTSFYIYDDSINITKEIFYENITNKWNLDMIDAKYFKEWVKNINYFKRNQVWYELSLWSVSIYSSQYKKFEDLNNLRNELILKLQK